MRDEQKIYIVILLKYNYIRGITNNRTFWNVLFFWITCLGLMEYLVK